MSTQPPTRSAAQAPAKAAPENPTIHFSHANEAYVVSVWDIMKMSPMELRLWRPLITAHQLETVNEDECENAGLILVELEKCLLIREAHYPK